MYVSVWKRFWAFLIDAAVFAVLFWALAQLINGWTVSLILLFIIWLYYAWLESSPWQASLGKRVMGLKVVDKRGRRLSFWKASKRLLTRIGTNLTFYFGFFTAAWDKHHETLHDHLSKSVVIAKDAEFDPEYYHDPGDHALTLVTVVSVILAVIFVVGLLACNGPFAVGQAGNVPGLVGLKQGIFIPIRQAGNGGNAVRLQRHAVAVAV